MGRRRYPLDALHGLRQQRVAQKAAVLSDSAARTAEARVNEARAGVARQSAQLALAELARAEQARLDQGQVRAGDLGAGADFWLVAEAELEAKVARERSAHDERLARMAAEAAALRALGSASNEAKIIDEHRSSFDAAEAARSERSEEEAALEQWTAVHFAERRS